MPYLVGIVLALGAALFARVTGFDRDRSFYPTVLVIIALLYGLFAAIGGSTTALVAECGPMVVFVLLAVTGHRYSAWLVVVGLASHGVFDFFHPQLITNPGVPPWWPQFCMAYDVTAAAYLGGLIRSRKTAVKS